MSIKSIAEHLSTFEGKGGTFERWDRQVWLLTTIYRLEDDATRILIGSKLKGKVER